jgi:hypothetical protein
MGINGSYVMRTLPLSGGNIKRKIDAWGVEPTSETSRKRKPARHHQTLPDRAV